MAANGHIENTNSTRLNPAPLQPHLSSNLPEHRHNLNVLYIHNQEDIDSYFGFLLKGYRHSDKEIHTAYVSKHN